MVNIVVINSANLLQLNNSRETIYGLGQSYTYIVKIFQFYYLYMFISIIQKLFKQ